MKRGRPVFSEVRQNMINILSHKKQAYGYELYSLYREIFGKVTLRLIYYHLKKGVFLGELKVHKVQKEKGEYSWGTEAEKIYYSLGENASATNSREIEKYFNRKQ